MLSLLARRAIAGAIGLTAAAVAGCAPRAPAVLSCANSGAGGRIVAIAGGSVDRGGVLYQREEQFGGRGEVADFTIDATEVTNRAFAAFVAATDYVTVAERRGPGGARNGAAVFDRAGEGWRIDPYADWRHPMGRGSSIRGQEDFPVVAVAYEDAAAYARWRGRRLPSELEWERAARGDGPALSPVDAEAVAADGRARANFWQGPFPKHDAGSDGFRGLAPVGCFEANAQGLYDMVGNVWEWTSDWYGDESLPQSAEEARRDDVEGIAKRVIKGGSHLCAHNFCSRFRSGSRQGADPGLGMSHIGFRTVGLAAQD